MQNTFNALADTNFQAIIDSLELLRTQTASWRDRSAEWAAAPENVEVEGGKYSAMHYALKSEGSRLEAALAEVGAQAAQLASETALTDAEAAQVAAEIAQLASELAQGIAEDEADAAGIARQGAESAESSAITAQGFAEDAQLAAEAAESNAADSAGIAEGERIAAEQAAALAEQYRNQAGDFSDIAESYAHYTDIWSHMTGPLAKPASVYHNGTFWMALDDIADITASEPDSGNPDWAEIGDSVKSVAGKTGSVTLEQEDIAGLPVALASKAGKNEIALPVPALPELMQVDPEEFAKALVSGYYEEGDIEKAVVWVWDDSRAKSDHDGWSCINPDHLAEIGTPEWYDPEGDDTDVAGDGVWERKNLNNLNVFDFGAKDESGYDNTLHFQLSADSLGYVGIPESENPFGISRIMTTRRTNFFPSQGNANIIVLPSGHDHCVRLIHEGSIVNRGIHFDANDLDKSPVVIAADHCKAFFTAEKVRASAAAGGPHISGLLIQGAVGAEFRVEAWDMSNTGYSNESTPRVVTIQGDSGDFRGDIYAEGVQCGLCLGGNVTAGDIGDLHLEDAADNGIYQLGSTSILNVNSFIYRGSEEAIVAGGRETNIDTVYISGACVACVSLTSGNMKIINFRVNGQVGASPATIFRARQNNVGRVEVMSLTGSIWGNTLTNLADANSVREFIIRSGDIDFYWDATRAGTSTQWFNCQTVQRLYLENFKCKIIAVNDDMPSGTILEVRAGQASGAGQVTVINPEFYLRQSDGETRLSGRSLRILRPDRATHTFIGCSFLTNVASQPAREADYLGPFTPNVNRANNAPEGNWAENTVIYNGTGSNPAGWVRRNGEWEELLNEDSLESLASLTENNIFSGTQRVDSTTVHNRYYERPIAPTNLPESGTRYILLCDKEYNSVTTQNRVFGNIRGGNHNWTGIAIAVNSRLDLTGGGAGWLLDYEITCLADLVNFGPVECDHEGRRYYAIRMTSSFNGAMPIQMFFTGVHAGGGILLPKMVMSADVSNVDTSPEMSPRPVNAVVRRDSTVHTGTIVADDFITASRVESDNENALQSLDNIADWKKPDGSLDYKKHYAYTPQIIEDKDGKIIEEKPGLSMEKRVAMMEKMIWELRGRNEDLRTKLDNTKRN